MLFSCSGPDLVLVRSVGRLVDGLEGHGVFLAERGRHLVCIERQHVARVAPLLHVGVHPFVLVQHCAKLAWGGLVSGKLPWVDVLVSAECHIRGLELVEEF